IPVESRVGELLPPGRRVPALAACRHVSCGDSAQCAGAFSAHRWRVSRKPDSLREQEEPTMPSRSSWIAGLCCIIVFAASIGGGRAQSRDNAGEWLYYGGDPASTKYAPLDK